MSYVVLVALVVFNYTPMGIKQERVALKINGVFPSYEACDRWLNKTGYDTLELVEDQIEKTSRVVAKKDIACVEDESKEI